MLKHIVSLAALISLSCAVAFGAPPKGSPPEGAVAGLALHPYWECVTTQATGLNFWEYDTFERIGSRWLHGTVRPVQPATSPYYDFYVGYTNSHWVYVQIQPSLQIYFVALSDGNTLDGDWKIVYPWKLTGYSVKTFPNARSLPTSLIIGYPDLTQVCGQVAEAPPSNASAALTAAPALRCSTWYASNGLPTSPKSSQLETLTISKPQPNTPWWQGVAKDNAGNVVYTYNVFSVGTENQAKRVSILVNPTSGVYVIADSYALHDLRNSAWIVRYPTVEPGFAFKDARYERTAPDQADLPSAFTLVFKDGYQKCDENAANLTP